MIKIIYSGSDARQKIKQGINKAGDIVKSTLGPAGVNVLIGSKFLGPKPTNDGFTVIKALHLEDETEEMAVRVLEDAAKTTNTIAGDATTTTIVIAQELFNAVDAKFSTNGLIKEVINPMAIKKEIDNAKLPVIEALKAKAITISTLEDIEKVAFVSVENKEIASLIASTVFKVGKSGVIKVEETETLGVNAIVTEGMEVQSGYITKLMAENGGETTLTNVAVLVVNGTIEHPESLSEVITELVKSGSRQLVVFAPAFDPVVLHALLAQRYADTASQVFKVTAVKTSPWDKGIHEDICTVTGATLVDVEKNMIPKYEHIARVDKIVVNATKTVIIQKDIDKLVSEELLQNELLATTNLFEKKKLEERIARINGKVALITVGAITETERNYLKDKIDDAVHATQGAMEEGVVTGGGVALKEIAESLPESLLTSALIAPYKQIVGSGILVDDSIIDSVKSIRVAIESACSAVGTLLTVGTTIAEKYEANTKQDN